MKTVTVKKEELLSKIKENRDNHRAVFEDALVVYKKRVIEEFEELLDRARKGERVAHSIGLRQPMDQTREYDQAIAMLEMSVEDEIELTNSEFKCLVLDQWGWKGQFMASNAIYVTEGDIPPTKYGRALTEE